MRIGDKLGVGPESSPSVESERILLPPKVGKRNPPPHTWEPTRNVLDVKENKVGSAVVPSYDYMYSDGIRLTVGVVLAGSIC